jgi:hypothetical protein
VGPITDLDMAGAKKNNLSVPGIETRSCTPTLICLHRFLSRGTSTDTVFAILFGAGARIFRFAVTIRLLWGRPRLSSPGVTADED